MRSSYYMSLVEAIILNLCLFIFKLILSIEQSKLTYKGSNFFSQILLEFTVKSDILNSTLQVMAREKRLNCKLCIIR